VTTQSAPSRVPRVRVRADAARNVEAILDAAERLLAADVTASMAAIATAAGVGRVTVYAHFSSRGELVDAVLARAIGQAERELQDVDTTGDPREALSRLVTATWRLVDRHRWMLAAAQGELGETAIRAHHARVLRRLSSVLSRGQRAGTFRQDLPRRWLVTVGYSLMHAAAEDVSQGRLKAEAVPALIIETFLSVLSSGHDRQRGGA
jgi:TetR/AcrR family transcriptional regulator, mexCD-oprJ operon repressor